ncbi:uncharacterized protein DS421_18g606660 [Arachis hypogaea]|nr:uncharacterized protein DS421_18g606660 [Arachis hypogaea]
MLVIMFFYPLTQTLMTATRVLRTRPISHKSRMIAQMNRALDILFLHRRRKSRNPMQGRRSRLRVERKKGRPRSVLMMMDLWKTFLMKMWTLDLWGEV